MFFCEEKQERGDLPSRARTSGWSGSDQRAALLPSPGRRLLPPDASFIKMAPILALGIRSMEGLSLVTAKPWGRDGGVDNR